MKFIERGLAEGDGVAEADQLGATVGGCVESGNAGSAGAGGIGIVERVLIEEVVAGERAFVMGPIGTQRAFVVLQGFGIGGGRKEPGGGVGFGDGCEQIVGRRGPGGLLSLRKSGAGKDALRG